MEIFYFYMGEHIPYYVMESFEVMPDINYPPWTKRMIIATSSTNNKELDIIGTNVESVAFFISKILHHYTDDNIMIKTSMGQWKLNTFRKAYNRKGTLNDLIAILTG